MPLENRHASERKGGDGNILGKFCRLQESEFGKITEGCDGVRSNEIMAVPIYRLLPVLLNLRT